MEIILTITKQQARNYLISHSWLVRKDVPLIEVLRHLGCIQVDPLGKAGKSHEIALFNRTTQFSRVLLQDTLYKERTVFEYWLQLYSIIPIENYPYLRRRMSHRAPWHIEYEKRHKKEIEEVKSFIIKNGTTSSRELNHIANTSSLFSWNSGGVRTAVLEYLWDTGEVAISMRKGGRKYYDLVGRVFPEDLLSQRKGDTEAIDFIITSSFRYTGLVRRPQLSRLGYVRDKAFKDRFLQLKQEGRVITVRIDDVKTEYFIHADFLEEFEKGIVDITHEKERHISILSPLDPLIIDRKMVEDIFEFSYRWEAYIPREKRVFDHYGMPVLYAGTFVGQVAVDRMTDGKLIIAKSTVIDKSITRSIGEEIEEMGSITRLE